MKKAWLIIAVVFVLALLIIGAKFLYDYLGGITSAQLAPQQTEPTADQLEPDAGETAEQTQPQRQFPPDFTAYDANGNPVKLSDMRGKPVIVNFWASWCSPCKQEMPDFEEAYKTYGDQVIFMMVNLTDGQRETQATAQAHIDNNGFTFPVYFDLDQSAAVAYNTVSIPATYLYDADGYLVTYGVGMLDAATIEQGIGMILN